MNTFEKKRMEHELPLGKALRSVIQWSVAGLTDCPEPRGVARKDGGGGAAPSCVATLRTAGTWEQVTPPPAGLRPALRDMLTSAEKMLPALALQARNVGLKNRIYSHLQTHFPAGAHPGPRVQTS